MRLLDMCLLDAPKMHASRFSALLCPASSETPNAYASPLFLQLVAGALDALDYQREEINSIMDGFRRKVSMRHVHVQRLGSGGLAAAR
eukprot:365848-Chlamydomonas_euryale.AAC.6